MTLLALLQETGKDDLQPFQRPTAEVTGMSKT